MENFIKKLGFELIMGQWYKDNMIIYQGYFVDSNISIECWTFTINNIVIFREDTSKFFNLLRSYFRKAIINDLI